MTAVVENLVSQMVAAERRLERLEAREGRRLITDYDWLRGWKDDFLGDQLADQYTAAVNGVGSVTPSLQDNAHGGVVRLVAGAGAGNYSRLWLGGGAGSPHRSLDTDQGFVMWALARIVAGLANVAYDICSITDFGTDYLFTRFDSNYHATNWVMIARDGGGESIFNSGVAADTSWHWHCIVAQTDRVEHLLDGVLINVADAAVPDAPGEALLQAYSRGNAGTLDINYWGVVPRNLT